MYNEQENKEWWASRPHGMDMEAVRGFIYKDTQENVLRFWDELKQQSEVFVCTNLSIYEDEINQQTELCIFYDFLHRVMLFDLERCKDVPELTLDGFKKYIGLC